MISGLVLAAGASRRMGELKQTMKVAGKPMLQHVIDAFKRSGLGEVVVVTRLGLQWKPSATGRVRVVVNPHPEEGLSSSLRLGLASLDSNSEAVVIGLGDKPLLLTSTIRATVSAYRKSGPRIIIPTYEGTRGNPILLPKAFYSEILRLKGDVGAKRVIEHHPEYVLEVPVRDAGVLVDANTPEDVGAVERLFAARKRLGAKRKPSK